jgi:FkbM family methyltransferase
MSVIRIFRGVFRRLSDRKDDRVVLDSPLLRYVDSGSLLAPEKLLRLGTLYGGWTLPADSGLAPDSVCYSAGAGEDISFDCALVERFGCRVRIIDPTPRAIQHFQGLGQAVAAGEKYPVNNSVDVRYGITAKGYSRLQFLPVGLADQNTEQRFYLPRNPAHVSCSTVNLQNTEEYFTAQCLRLSTIMRQEGDTSIDLLKMDIEGAEYAVINDIVVSELLPRLLLVEFDEIHTPLDADASVRIRQHIDLLLEAGMRCVAVDGSNATFVKCA